MTACPPGSLRGRQGWLLMRPWRKSTMVGCYIQALLEHWPRPTLDEESGLDSQGGQAGRQGTGNEYSPQSWTHSCHSVRLG